ncbi:Gfo/Idh/MocA family oxidoreductase [Pigmentiphaga kullae]|uniref:4-carboxy-2-hydroxymuconate semialdehyde dehydrogenase n=1 Tax=Pigmentiphaga kullae TaxID=151784 RepID=A0A4Q7NFF2_9BURK|nr:Gfo/Idh/MocA family oxidoreductase [Pigmentiphaga kullae]RZS81407.1 4-carboxy-2-hydroxymuconate semialdehyde dehydrogenase [Pigmentiphaga kullae]
MPARSSAPIRLCIAGEGAMGSTHARIFASMPGVKIVALAAADMARGRQLAAQYGIADCTGDLAAALARPDVDAVVLATPSGLHAEHAELAARLGKPMLIEIPAALTLADTERLARVQAETGVPMMVAHSRRFAPPHTTLRERIQSGDFTLHHLVCETYFFRRNNLNMFGEPRTWVDSLLWHHACHTVDLFCWLLDESEFDVWGQRGPDHPELGIPMDVTVAMRSRKRGTLLTMAMSFNNKGPFGGFYRYIGEEDTYRAFRDELTDSDGKVVEMPGAQPAFEAQDTEFIAALREGRPSRCDIASVLPAMRALDGIDRIMRGEPAAR